VSAEILELLTRIAELERKLDSLFRHGPVYERRKIEGCWFVRLKIGGTEEEPFLSPWIPYSSPNGGQAGLNVHRVPARGEQLTMLSPAGDFRQAVATSLFWSNDHPPPSEDEDAVTITHPKFRLDLKDGTLKIETSENVDIKSTQTIKLDAGQTITLSVRPKTY
jgi:phage baseplate assembly protein gpV